MYLVYTKNYMNVDHVLHIVHCMFVKEVMAHPHKPANSQEQAENIVYF